ncbi:hypothetical protein [Cytobacillus sp. FSL R5-0596]|uniref:hypothetical protein n=1 Tax=Cytobacillus sp. FSL R5-0596 TaxID=2954696 RepID=UPI0030FC23FD
MKWTEKTDSSAALLDLKIPTVQGKKALSSFIDLRSTETPNEIPIMTGTASFPYLLISKAGILGP